MTTKIILVSVSVFLCILSFGQGNSVKSIQERFARRSQIDRLDSLKHLLAGSNFVKQLNPSGRLMRTSVVRKSSKHSAKVAARLMTQNCDYLCGTMVCPDMPAWIGAVDSNWYNADNWCTQKVPIADTNVLVLTGAHYPVIKSDTVAIHDLTLSNGSLLTIRAGAAIKVSGAIVADSNINAVAGTIIYAGRTSQFINPKTFIKNTVRKLTIDNPHGVTLNTELWVANGQEKASANDKPADEIMENNGSAVKSENLISSKASPSIKKTAIKHKKKGR